MPRLCLTTLGEMFKLVFVRLNFVDGVSMEMVLMCNLHQKLDDDSALPTRSRHLILNTN